MDRIKAANSNMTQCEQVNLMARKKDVAVNEVDRHCNYYMLDPTPFKISDCLNTSLYVQFTFLNYRRFTVSWVSVKVAWVTFYVSFDNFLQISHCRYSKYYYPIK